MAALFQDLPPVKGHNVQMENAPQATVIPLRLVTEEISRASECSRVYPERAMTRRWVRVLVLLLTVAVTAYVVWRATTDDAPSTPAGPSGTAFYETSAEQLQH